MDSPERDSNASSSSATSSSTSSATSSSTSSAFQDSSFLNYLSALSPINPSKPTNVGQALAELNFPPPPPVFTSPHINPRRETSYLKRSQYLNTSAKDPSLNFIPEGKILEQGPNIYGPYGTQCTVDLIRCTQNESGDKASVQVQPCSPSGCVDQFLADTLEECANSDSPDLCSRHATDTPQEIQNVCNSPKGTTGPVVSDNNDDCVIRRAVIIEASPQPGLENPQGQNLSNKNESTEAIRDVIRAGGSEQKNDGRQPNRWDNTVSEGFQCIEADLPMGSTSSKQNDEVAVNKTAKQFPSFLLCNRDCDIGGSENEIPIHVSNLQSDEAKEVMAHPAESGQRGNCNQEWLPESFGIVNADLFHDGNIGAVSSGTVENMINYACKEASQYQRGMRRRCLQFEATEAHRKSLENSSSSSNKANIDPSEMRCDSSMGSEALNTHDAVSYMTSTNKQVIKSSSHASSRLSSCSLETPESHIDNFNSSVRIDGSSPVASSVPSGIGLHLNSIVNVAAASCEINTELPGNDYLNELGEKLLCGSDCSTQEDLRGALVPYEIESHVSRDACRLELLQASPRKKRKREPNTLESEGCKRCNCKKTKCLKLYCDCFAAGVYCAEACTCHECFNKPEYEDTVLGTRQQIESRNPLAFAPKIVRSVTESPQDNEDDNRTTPASARHKRGCNCKKSMCLKKYCECYQAGVGCSDGCRCESCKNVFGKKEDMEHRKDKDERWEDVSDMKLRTDASQPEQWHPSNLSPLIQCSNHRKSISESRDLTGSKQVSSPNSEVSLLSSYGEVPNSQQTSDRNYRLKKVKEGNEGQVLYHQAQDYQKACDVDPFLPRWDGRLDIHEYTQLQLQPQLGASASLASDMYPSKALQAYLCQESGNSSVGSLRWLGSPASPNACFNGSKFVIGPNSDNRLYNIVEDETPHILKETDSMEAVKVNSPNKKRISPPHNSLHELTRSNSSPVLKSARKFILQSVPSFPSLSPYSEPNESEEP